MNNSFKHTNKQKSLNENNSEKVPVPDNLEEIVKFGARWIAKKHDLISATQQYSPQKFRNETAQEQLLFFYCQYQISKNSYFYGAYASAQSFINNTSNLEPKDKRFHESLFQNQTQHRLFADIDFHAEMNFKQVEDFLDKFADEFALALKKVKVEFNTNKLIILLSEGIKNKHSFHTIYTGVTSKHLEVHKFFWNSCFNKDSLQVFDTEKQANICPVDFQVYRVGALRCIYSTKWDENRPITMYDKENPYDILDCFVQDSENKGGSLDCIYEEMEMKAKSKAFSCVKFEDDLLAQIETITGGQIRKTSGALIEITSDKTRKCLINGLIHPSNNCYCVREPDGIYYYCFGTACREQKKKIIDFSELDFSKSDKTFYDISIKHRKTMRFQEIVNLLKSTIRYVANNGRPFYLCKDVKEIKRIEGNIRHRLTYYNYTSILAKDLKGTYFFEEESKDEKDKGKRLLYTVLDIIRTSITVRKVEFDPYAWYHPEEENENLNLFTGYLASRGLEKEKEAQTDGSQTDGLNMIINHIKEIWCNGNEEHFQFVIKWLAKIVKTPWEKTESCLVLKSEQGAGKNILVDFIGQKVLGMKYYLTFDSITELMSNFNKIMQGKMLICLDECGSSSFDYKNADRIKSLITRKNFIVEEKCEARYEIDDFANYIFLTNHELAVRIEKGDRRHFVLECNNKRVGDVDYFDKFLKVLNDDNAVLFYNYLMETDITNFHSNKPPTTRLKEQIQEETTPAAVRFYKKFSNSKKLLNFGNNVALVPSSKLYEFYCNWFTKHCGTCRKPIGKDRFIKDINPIATLHDEESRRKQKKAMIYEFVISDCLKELKKKPSSSTDEMD